MNQGQQMFYDFAIARAQEGKEADLKAILQESFKRQYEGTFTMEYMNETAPKMMSLLRPESVEEFQKAAAHFKGELNQ